MAMLTKEEAFDVADIHDRILVLTGKILKKIEPGWTVQNQAEADVLNLYMKLMEVARQCQIVADQCGITLPVRVS